MVAGAARVRGGPGEGGGGVGWEVRPVPDGSRDDGGGGVPVVLRQGGDRGGVPDGEGGPLAGPAEHASGLSNHGVLHGDVRGVAPVELGGAEAPGGVGGGGKKLREKYPHPVLSSALELLEGGHWVRLGAGKSVHEWTPGSVRCRRRSLAQSGAPATYLVSKSARVWDDAREPCTRSACGRV